MLCLSQKARRGRRFPLFQYVAVLLPLAFSHAALGSAFYYGIFGHDLAAEWRALLP